MSIQRTSKYDHGREPAPLLERIRNNCKITKKGCWLWLGVSVKGYGRTTVGSRRDGSRKHKLCHVATWEHVNGPVPEGMTLDHYVCNKSMCCNPDHVRPVTLWENVKRSKTNPVAINARKKRCSKCSGKLIPKPSGKGRYCRPCNLAYLREYNAKRNGKKES